MGCLIFVCNNVLNFITTLCQWCNSYGLWVGKPAGTRAEGAPAGCPFTLVFQLRLPFQKGAPFQHLFHSLVAKFSTDTLHKLMKSELLGLPPTTRAGGNWGRNFTYVRYTEMCRPNGWIFWHKKICKHGSHFDPPTKNPKTRVKF